MALTPTVGESTSNLFLSTMQITSKSILHHGPRSSYRVYYVGLIAAALVLIAMLDRATGDVPFQHLYYLPIILAATEFGFPGGLMTSLFSVLLYHLANPRLLFSQELRQGKMPIFSRAGDELFRSADQALYQAKEMGEDSVSTG
jgi:glucose-6-phosphate-specific signal transduction histidine kinase